MTTSLRCKVSGHDRDECGVCRRCGDDLQSGHAWNEVERRQPCFRLESCERCQAEREKPDHDWDLDAATNSMKCSRCGLSI